MYNILIVDDSDIDRMMIESNLRIPDAVPIVAENGLRAVEKLREWSIDLVLTDLLMPRMDGLELVQTMRREFPQIPVIVTTGTDSEGMAAEAIAAGAVSYIPKDNLAEMLRPSVQRILDLSHSMVGPSQIHDCMRTAHFEFDFGNDQTQLRSLINFVVQLLAVVTPLVRNDRLRIAMAVEQALNNALYRGNLEISSEYKVHFANRTSDIKHLELIDGRMNSKPYMQRRIQVVIDIKPSRFAIRVKDGGRGFDSASVGSWEHADARGIILMKAFMDTVEYNKEGNDVQMFFYFERDEHGKPLGQAHAKQASPAADTPPVTKKIRSKEANPSTTPAAAANAPAANQAAEKAPVKSRIARLKCMKTGKTIVLQEEKTVVGSRPNCHVHLSPNSKVAPLHCFIIAEPSSWVLVQLAPQHPTLVNTHQVEGRTRLKHGDIINLGTNDLEFELVNT